MFSFNQPVPGQLNLFVKAYPILLFYSCKLRRLINMWKVHSDRPASVGLISLIKIFWAFWQSNLTHLFELLGQTIINIVS